MTDTPSPFSSSSSSAPPAKPSLTASARLLSPEQIAIKAGETVQFLRLPDPSRLYVERAERLQALAQGHALDDYLRFIALIAGAQQRVADAYPALPLPDAQQIAAAADQIIAPLPAARLPRSNAWIDGLHRLLDDLSAQLGASPAQALIAELRGAPTDHLDRQADRILNGIGFGLNLATAPLISAALQVHWSALVAQVAATHGPQAFGRTRRATHCPCCDSAPTASITRIGAEQSGTRYLHCSLCATQWHLVRIKCGHCESTKGIHYQELADGTDDVTQPNSGSMDSRSRELMPGNGRNARSAAVKAECCDECGHYLKIMQMERDPAVDPVADDLATVSLDLLVTESGKQPAGVNLMLWFGEDSNDR